MGKSSPSPPPAPDPAATAAAQAAADKETAIAQAQLNQVNQYGPYGTLEYEQRGTTDDGTPQYSATTTLNPEQQQQLDLTNQAGIAYGETANNQLAQVQDLLGSPLDFSTLGDAPVANENTRQAHQAAILARAQPQIDRDFETMRTQLANQGINLGSQGYEDAMRLHNSRLNDLSLGADAAAGDEMARMYGLEANAYDRAANQMVQERQIPLNELSAMLSGTQVQSPQFVNTPQTGIASPPVADSIYNSYQGQLNNYNQQVAQQNAQTQGLYSLLGAGAQAAFAFSDRRLKHGIVRIGELANGLGVYLYRYIWGGPSQVGLMADEVRKVHPDAVVTIAGFDAVNYAEAVK